MKYNLTVDSEQLQHIAKALDFYTRIQLGQLSELTNPYMLPLQDTDYETVKLLIKELKQQMFPELPEDKYHSIRSKKANDDLRQIVDIYETIRYTLAQETKEPNNIPKPYHWSGEKDLPKLIKENTDANS